MSKASNLPIIRPLYDWAMRLAAHGHAKWALFLVSFAESSFFPIPPDVMLIPMVLANRAKAWQLAAICTLGSVLGGLFGYYIGFALYEVVAQPIVDFYHASEKVLELKQYFNDNGGWLVFTAGFTPIPYKVFTIASGMAELPLLVFIIASAIGRGARFFLVAALLWKFGTPIRDFIEKYLGWMTLLFCLLVIAGVAVLKLL